MPRPGKQLPRYQCTECGHVWSLGGWRRPCPNCEAPGPHEWVRMGCQGYVVPQKHRGGRPHEK